MGEREKKIVGPRPVYKRTGIEKIIRWRCILELKRGHCNTLKNKRQSMAEEKWGRVTANRQGIIDKKLLTSDYYLNSGPSLD